MHEVNQGTEDTDKEGDFAQGMRSIGSNMHRPKLSLKKV